MKANATDLPPPAPVTAPAPAEAVTALYRAHALGLIHSAGRDWVGVISGNRFTPLNVPSSLGTYAFGTW